MSLFPTARFPSRLLALLLLATSAAAQVRVLGIEPARHSVAVDSRAVVRVHFDRTIDPATLPPLLPSFQVMGTVSAALGGTFALENGGLTVRFEADRAFHAGEDVTVRVLKALRGTDGTRVRRMGYTWRFRVATRPAPIAFRVVDDHDLRAGAPASPRVYGASTGDLNADGYPDFPVTCEDSHDVRVLMSRGDATGRYLPFLPPYGTQQIPSPSACVDIDGDGLQDVVVANIGSHVISVLRGLGDGTFQPRLDYPCGHGPMGLAVFDVDGDGDLDAVTANSAGDDLTCMLNDGTGAFLPPTFFESGANGEIAIAAEDMDENGVLDLVVAAGVSQRVQVLLDDGPGAWTLHASAPCGGRIWGLQLGDADGDGHLDLSAANWASSNGALLFGDGLGGLSAPTILATGNLTIATDFGDLDGDGDNDLVYSSFGNGWWRLFVNDGAGNMTFHQDITAPASPACSILVDFDRDRDLDLVLFDEIADRVMFLANGTDEATTICAGDGIDVTCPCGNAGGPGRGCAHSGNPQGAALEAAGTTLPDTLVLTGSGMTATTVVLFLAGDGLQAPIPFGDGLLCVGGFIRRFGGQTAVAGSVAFPFLPTQLVSTASGTASGSGEARFYQVYYRNAAPFCTPATSNVTNGLVVVW